MRSVVCLLVVLAAAVAAAPAGAATSIKRYDPFTADGDPAVRQYYHGSAECSEPSRISARRDAWRCVSGNIALDPCFQSPTDDEVLCVTDPFANRGHLLSAVLDPEGRTDGPATRPWALVVRGHQCVLSRSRKRGRRRPSYVCGRRGPYLFGRPNQRTRTWTIRLARNRRGRLSRRVRIRSAFV